MGLWMALLGAAQAAVGVHDLGGETVVSAGVVIKICGCNFFSSAQRMALLGARGQRSHGTRLFAWSNNPSRGRRTPREVIAPGAMCSA